MSSNVVSLSAYRQEKLAAEIRKEMETVHPHTDYGGLVKLPSLDDYDREDSERTLGAEGFFGREIEFPPI